ncbi:MAG TPA: zinc ribbon domain-containing protein [Gemmatimonadales bacterium]|nr:zinc ribbon domain-containing protein [Gemmatimonadales bacterium]
MPTYEYRCPEGHDFELFQKMSDKPRAKCPVCGKPATRQISGGAGLVFKGTGFYITDYGKDGKGPRKESAASPASTPSSSDSSTASSTPASDTKPAAEKPAKPARKKAAE